MKVKKWSSKKERIAYKNSRRTLSQELCSQNPMHSRSAILTSKFWVQVQNPEIKKWHTCLFIYLFICFWESDLLGSIFLDCCPSPHNMVQARNLFHCASPHCHCCKQGERRKESLSWLGERQGTAGFQTTGFWVLMELSFITAKDALFRG